MLGIGSAALIMFVLIGFTAYAWRGFVLATLWGWFAVPIFNVAPITITMAIGLLLLIRIAIASDLKLNLPKKTGTEPENKSSGELAEAFLKMYVFPLIILVLGYIVHLFM